MTRSSILILGFLLLLGIHPVFAEHLKTHTRNCSTQSSHVSSVSLQKQSKQMYAPSAKQQHASRSQKADQLLKHFQTLDLKVKKTSTLDFPSADTKLLSKDKYKHSHLSRLDHKIVFLSQYLKSPLDKPPRKMI